MGAAQFEDKGRDSYILGAMPEPIERVDRWLWAARFFKTRSVARAAVSGGHVHVNGVRVKPSRALKPGDELTVRKGELEWCVIVKAPAQRRGPATEAAALYEETEASVRRREAGIEDKRMKRMHRAGPERRPGKKQRRDLRRFFDLFRAKD